MRNSFDEKILDEAKDWLAVKRNVVLATVIQTWGSSPRPIGSRCIINDKGDPQRELKQRISERYLTFFV
jgi:hypothetical protein